MTKLVTLTALLLSSMCASCATEDTTTEGITPVSPTETTQNTTTTNAAPLSVSATTFILDDFFSNRDYRTTVDAEEPVTLTFSGSSISVSGSESGLTVSGSTVTITKEGTYILTGDLANGQVVVDMADDSDKVQLMLDNVTMSNNSEAPIAIYEADKVFVTMVEGSSNSITVNLSDDADADAGIYSKRDITFNGEGTLTVNAKNGDGITGKDELTFTSGTYHITADGHGLDANDCIAIADGTFHITSGKDGLHSEHSSNVEKGYIFIADGTFVIDAQLDGIDAGAYLEVWDGHFEITTCGGSEAAPVKVASANNHNMGGMGQTGQMGQMGGQSQGQMGGQSQMGQTGGQTQADITPLPDAQMQGGQQQGGQMGQQQGQGEQLSPLVQDGSDVVMGDLNNRNPQSQQGGQGQMGEVTQMPEGTDAMMGARPEMEQGMDDMMGARPEMEHGMGLEIPPEFADLTPEEINALMEEMIANMGDRPGMTEMAPVVDTTTEEDLPSTKGLKSAGTMRLYGGTFVLDCYDDSIHSDSVVEIHDGTYTLSTGDDAIHANWDTYIGGGTIDILTSFEGIEGQRVDIRGGDITMYCGDDGINGASTSMDPTNSNVYIHISGGSIVMDTNAEGDGLDSNGSIAISGGSILVSSTTDQRDTALDSQYDSIITGGSFIATGSNSGTIQNFDEGSTQGSILVMLSAVQTGRVTLKDSSGTALVDFDPVKAYQAVTISTPDLAVGETYTLTMGEQSQTITMDTLIYGGGSHSMGGGNMGGGRR